MNTKSSASQGRVDPSEAAAYSLAEAARYIKVPVATLRSWVLGRPYLRSGSVVHSKPLISPPSRRPPLLSFSNLIEAHVLRSLRTEHGVSLKDLRKALNFAENQLHIERLLLSGKLRTDAGQLFLDQYGKLIDLSASGQIALRRMFDEHLKRVEWGRLGAPIRLYPFIASGSEVAARPIAIDPHLAFGRPVVARTGVTTQAIADRLDAGESVEEIASDYDLEVPEIEEAVLYERAA